MNDCQILPREKKQTNMTPLIQQLQIVGWNGDTPLITITTWVQGAVHKQSLGALEKLQIPPREVKTNPQSTYPNGP